jgi:hypothetical protein
MRPVKHSVDVGRENGPRCTYERLKQQTVYDRRDRQRGEEMIERRERKEEKGRDT